MTKVANGVAISTWAAPMVNSDSGIPSRFAMISSAMPRIIPGTTSGSASRPSVGLRPTNR